MTAASSPIKRKAPNPDKPFGPYSVEDLRFILRNDCFKTDTPYPIVDLIMAGVDIHQPFMDSKVSTEVTPLFSAVKAGAARCVDKLISLGSDVHFRDSSNYTPLIEAAAQGKIAILESLLNAGADHRDKSKSQHTALHLSCIQGFTDCARLLLERGASMECRTELGFSPLDQAARGEHQSTLELLLMHGANPNAQCGLDSDVEGEAHMRYRALNHYGQTPLFWACAVGRMDIVHMLLKFGAKADILDNRNRTPFEYAALCGQLKALPTLLDLGFFHGGLKELANRIQPAVNDADTPSSLGACIDFLYARHAAEAARGSLSDMGLVGESDKGVRAP